MLGYVRRAGARAVAGLATVVMVAGSLVGTAGAPASAQGFKVLVFSKTAGFRHASIPAGIAAIEQLGAENGFQVDATEDAASFTAANLAQYAAVVWLSTTGDVLNTGQQAAFEGYIRAGGGYVGVHSASDTEYDWAWYGGLMGAYFASHPANQTATVTVEDRGHPSTAHLGPTWTRFDEWYNFRASPRGRVHVLASLDESTYQPGGGAMGADHPISWCHDYDGGRAWYTGMGHTTASYSERAFLDHLLGGIRSAAGAVAADCGVTTPPPTGIAGRTYTLTAVHSGRLMDVEGASTADGASIIQWSAHGGSNQRWQAVDAGGGAVQLRAAHSGKCLDVDLGSTNAGAALKQSTCTGQDRHKWLPVPVSNGIYTLRNVGSGLCADVEGGGTADGARVLQWTCKTSGNTANQQWRLTEVS